MHQVQRYTQIMKQQLKRQRIIALLLLLITGLASCSPGHMGSNEIAFVRDGHLWTIDPDGSNAFEVVSDSTAVIGYAWSPNHQIFAFRTLNSNFAHTIAARHLTSNSVTGLIQDAPSVLNTVGIDGGSPITTPPPNPGTVSWWVSQNDQPEDIARKLLPYTFSIPSLSGNHSMAIGNSEQGVFTTTLAGTNFQLVIQAGLPGHPLPAALERMLWQPAYQNPTILYAIPTASTKSQPPTSMSMVIQLVLRDPRGHTTRLAVCGCTQFAWSPDGNSVLYSTGTTYTILNIKDLSSFSVSGEVGSVPYWSPDSKSIVLDGLYTLRLIYIVDHRQQLLLNDKTATAESGTVSSAMPGTNALLQPVSNSPWASDSHHFLFLTRGRLLWQGKSLSSGNGLYMVSIDGHGQVQGSLTVIDTGNDAQAGWTYEDPNTSFLF